MRRLVGLVLAAVVAAGCASAASEDAAVPATSQAADNQQPVVADVAPDDRAADAAPRDESNDERGSEYLFDDDLLHTFELELSDEDLAFLDDDPRREEYVEGSVTFEGQTIEQVGIRYKGSIGAFVGCLENGFQLPPTGSKTCTKLSMKVKLNWLDTSDTFLGVKKLQFHSQNIDPTHMHERLGYWIFREMDVPAPRSTHARLVVNGEYLGVFALTEQIDGRFANDRFDDGSGNVLKEVWPIDESGRPTPEGQLVEGLRTNEEDADVTRFRAFGEAIAAADDAELAELVSTSMDVDQLMTTVVIDRAIRNDDGPFHWYCFGPCTNHNYYWYSDPSTGLFHLIPWDLDNAFENIVLDANPVTPIADGWGEISNDCEPFPSGGFQLLQRSAACDRLTAAWVSFDDEYRAAAKRLLEGPFADGVIDAQLDRWAAQIAPSVAEAAEMHNDAPSPSDWERDLDRLRRSLEFARDELETVAAS